ncbi:MAG: DNA replication/repair protein RecF [Cyanobacteria bacterium]|nr:DNA replication/repair protein RecF [Cyanobacteriota bacterium]
MVFVQALSAQNFRNLAPLSCEFSPGLNWILGDNGQGKTNLLESIYLLSNARSHRAKNERELIAHTANNARITAQVLMQQTGGHHVLEMTWERPQTENGRLKTILKQNHQPLKSRSQLLGNCPSVSFFVTDLLLLRGQPEDRRRWLDAAAAQYDRRHFQLVSTFQKIRLQKAHLLREYLETGGASQDSLTHLAVWNDQFAEASVRLMQSRQHYLALIQDRVTCHYIDMAPHETLSLSYHSSVMARVLDASAFDEDAFRQELDKIQVQECRRGQCLIGPHRDDVQFFLNNQDATAYGSQGQQRSIVLALKLGEWDVLSGVLCEPPVLLLDDVMAELDPERQDHLIQRLAPEAQVFLTTTHIDRRVQASLESHLGEGQSQHQKIQMQRGQVQCGALKLETAIS